MAGCRSDGRSGNKPRERNDGNHQNDKGRRAHGVDNPADHLVGNRHRSDALGGRGIEQNAEWNAEKGPE